ncbi:LysM peptidoglycan-binding domain-containing protein, partial [Catenulispora pinisilvae]|uniref:LysM peptidoglycan-binding domain-containing protein n=1 Tax=Catenulispora pinisilvae TaxID=2705253 RepID=UPI001890F69F
SSANQSFGSTRASGQHESVHTVRPGESLYTIAAEDLGDGTDWPQLYTLNQGVVQADGDKLTNPDLIRPDWKIRITASADDPSDSTTGRSAAPLPAAPTPTPPAAAVPTPALTAPTTPHATGHPSPDAPRTTPSAPHTAPPQQSQPPVADTPHERPTRRHGGAAVGLPDGGAIGITLAVALGSAVVLARRCRTRLTAPR